VFGQETPRSFCVVPEVCEDQDDPPLFVATIVPPTPTAQQALVVGHEIAWRSVAVPELCELQLEPPLVVPRIVPAAPAA
jgi:hypothetical protein